jgi:AP-5 complex subunit zeta-1
MDAEAVYGQLLRGLPSERFHSPTLAFEVIHFCTHNLALFDSHFLSLLRLSFPSLFKACVGFIGVGPGLPCR